MPRIYTKTGDKGKTGLIGGQRAWKDSPRIEAYGDVDELNSVLAVAGSFLEDVPEKIGSQIDSFIKKTQNELFNLGCQLANPKPPPHDKLPQITESEVADLEKFIDNLERDLPPLSQFILPGGNSLSATVHLARSICRRAERRSVALSKSESMDPIIVIYLNRLSDTLFVLARWIQKQSGINEIPWGNRALKR